MSADDQQLEITSPRQLRARMDRIGQRPETHQKRIVETVHLAAVRRSGQPVAALLEDGAWIEDVQRVEGLLDRQ
jgi:hypothetical protein